ncbi:MAG TPA: hypothetical protein VEH04_17055 [Verrucomicrobiae bacterium]|nr:hypothetical protein [Verrucomicrobiae bacterium]
MNSVTPSTVTLETRDGFLSPEGHLHACAPGGHDALAAGLLAQLKLESKAVAGKVLEQVGWRRLENGEWATGQIGVTGAQYKTIERWFDKSRDAFVPAAPVEVPVAPVEVPDVAEPPAAVEVVDAEPGAIPE